MQTGEKQPDCCMLSENNQHNHRYLFSTVARLTRNQAFLESDNPLQNSAITFLTEKIKNIRKKIATNCSRISDIMMMHPAISEPLLNIINSSLSTTWPFKLKEIWLSARGITYWAPHCIFPPQKHLSYRIFFLDAEMLAHAFITLRPDYCNALVAGCPIVSINKLQFI